MSRATGLIAKLDSALRRTGPQDRTVYKRVVTPGTGDKLIRRTGAPTYVDTILDPQPSYQRLARFLVGPQSKSEEVVQSGSDQVANQYMVIFSASAISKAELASENVLILLQDSAGNNEVFKIDDYEEVALQGVDVTYIAYIGSVKRP